MNWFKNFSIKKKMVVSFLLVIALLVMIAAVAAVEMNNIAGDYKFVINNPMESEMQMRIFDKAVTEIRRMSANMVMFAPANDPERIESYLAEARNAYEEGKTSLGLYREAIMSDETISQEIKSEVLEELDLLERAMTGYMTEVCDPVAIAAANGDYDSAIGFVAAGVEYGEILSVVTDDLIKTAEENANATVLHAEEESNRTVWVLIVIASVSAAAALVIAFYVATLISTPLLPLTAFMNKAATTGDLTLEQKDIECIAEFAKMEDETGMTIRSAAAFVERVTEISNLLSAIAKGDLTVEATLLSEKDTMGMALHNMLDNLNIMFGEIDLSATQVSVGSKQIADGAQSLAQGSTEQAASIEMLSDSITDVTNKTKQNADMTEKAATLAGTIKSNAEKGSMNINEMMSAVNDINEASRKINNVIKVIDDIAFQTNILALNAAVEAARAGSHGKGFAVVAEEVRSLASKCSDAAKETEEMIKDSIEKTELGTQIAEKTAENFSEIVSGVSESSELIDEIARSSEEQSSALSRISSGIGQVVQVIQQNSATAQQSAAASEEMSGQSDMLEQLIGRFNTKQGLHSAGGSVPMISLC